MLGHGFVGRELVPQLLNGGHHLTLVSRQAPQKFEPNLDTQELIHIRLDPSSPESWKQSTLLEALSQAEGIVNLAGEPIAEKRWTTAHCKKIENSRIETTQALINALNELKRPPRVLVNASAVGYYGTSQESQFKEESKSGEDFLAELCKKWEQAALKKPRSTRLILLRIGVVLGPDGGALGKMLPVFKAGLGGPIGSGNQWMSWIHRTDLCQLIEQALTQRVWSGVINCVAPNPIQMSVFAKELGLQLGRPSLLQVPGPILKLLLGDGASVVLEGQKVISTKLPTIGFKFKYSKLKEALAAATNSKMPT